MKKIVTLLFCLGLISGLAAQDRNPFFDVKFGAGLGLMGSGDMYTLSFENELNCKINNFLSGALSLGYGKGERGVHDHTAYLMGSANLFLSPFRNNRRNNLKIGGGASVFSHSNTYLQSGNEVTGYSYNLYRERTAGFNLILEDEHRIGSHLLIGAKLFVTGGIRQGGIISGAMVKAGVVL
jgi:hypothetical protein